MSLIYGCMIASAIRGELIEGVRAESALQP